MHIVVIFSGRQNRARQGNKSISASKPSLNKNISASKPSSNKSLSASKPNLNKSHLQVNRVRIKANLQENREKLQSFNDAKRSTIFNMESYNLFGTPSPDGGGIPAIASV
jgi:hypothetical protein